MDETTWSESKYADGPTLIVPDDRTPRWLEISDSSSEPEAFGKRSEMMASEHRIMYYRSVSFGWGVRHASNPTATLAISYTGLIVHM